MEAAAAESAAQAGLVEEERARVRALRIEIAKSCQYKDTEDYWKNKILKRDEELTKQRDNNESLQIIIRHKYDSLAEQRKEHNFQLQEMRKEMQDKVDSFHHRNDELSKHNKSLLNRLYLASPTQQMLQAEKQVKATSHSRRKAKELLESQNAKLRCLEILNGQLAQEKKQLDSQLAEAKGRIEKQRQEIHRLKCGFGKGLWCGWCGKAMPSGSTTMRADSSTTLQPATKDEGPSDENRTEGQTLSVPEDSRTADSQATSPPPTSSLPGDATTSNFLSRSTLHPVLASPSLSILGTSRKQRNAVENRKKQKGSLKTKAEKELKVSSPSTQNSAIPSNTVAFTTPREEPNTIRHTLPSTSTPPVSLAPRVTAPTGDSTLLRRESSKATERKTTVSSDKDSEAQSKEPALGSQQPITSAVTGPQMPRLSSGFSSPSPSRVTTTSSAAASQAAGRSPMVNFADTSKTLSESLAAPVERSSPPQSKAPLTTVAPAPFKFNALNLPSAPRYPGWRAAFNSPQIDFTGSASVFGAFPPAPSPAFQTRTLAQVTEFPSPARVADSQRNDSDPEAMDTEIAMAEEQPQEPGFRGEEQSNAAVRRAVFAAAADVDEDTLMEYEKVKATQGEVSDAELLGEDEVAGIDSHEFADFFNPSGVNDDGDMTFSVADGWDEVDKEIDKLMEDRDSEADNGTAAAGVPGTFIIPGLETLTAAASQPILSPVIPVSAAPSNPGLGPGPLPPGSMLVSPGSSEEIAAKHQQGSAALHEIMSSLNQGYYSAITQTQQELPHASSGLSSLNPDIASTSATVLGGTALTPSLFTSLGNSISRTPASGTASQGASSLAGNAKTTSPFAPTGNPVAPAYPTSNPFVAAYPSTPGYTQAGPSPDAARPNFWLSTQGHASQTPSDAKLQSPYFLRPNPQQIAPSSGFLTNTPLGQAAAPRTSGQGIQAGLGRLTSPSQMNSRGAPLEVPRLHPSPNGPNPSAGGRTGAASINLAFLGDRRPAAIDPNLIDSAPRQAPLTSNGSIDIRTYTASQRQVVPIREPVRTFRGPQPSAVPEVEAPERASSATMARRQVAPMRSMRRRMAAHSAEDVVNVEAKE